MNRRTIVAILTVIGALMIFNLFSKDPAPDGDRQVIAQLEKHGSNTSKPHNIDFFLYYPSEETARAALAHILTEYPSMRADVHQSEVSKDWTLQLKGTFIPTLETMHKIRADFTEVNKLFQGDYDGWGAEIVD